MLFKKVLYLASIVIFLCAFNFQDNPNAFWYEQSMPPLGNRSLTDMVFLDSLIGFACTDGTGSDNGYVLKTTNGGNNWIIVLERSVTSFNTIGIVDNNIMYISATPDSIYKTTNGGNNWTSIFLNGIFSKGIHIINKDTLWVASNIEFDGGAYISTNGGANWQNKFSLFGANPSRVYFYNKNIGFIARDNTVNSYLRMTTNGGDNWTLITGATGFGKMDFVDSLTGWKNVSGNLEKTTNGGLNWFRLFNTYFGSPGHQINDYKVLSEDTIWGVGGYILLNGYLFRGLVYKTTNGGSNWSYQIPDTNIIIGSYELIDFVNQKTGWCYDNFSRKGIHTKVGGDTTSYPVSVKNISSVVPEDFVLYQNYPNPFNPTTKISFSIKRKTANVKLDVFDVSGKLISELVNRSFNAGTYEVNFNASNLSSGVYFYTLVVNNDLIDTKKMMMIK